MKVFTHYGKSGDLIYSLMCIKNMGGGDLIITPKYISRDYYLMLLPLLNKQPYLNSVEYSNELPSDIIDLNRWRDVGYEKTHGGGQHISLSHIECLKMFYDIDVEYTPEISWLLNIDNFECDVPYIVIQRSLRYHAVFDYSKKIDNHIQKIFFCGGRDEFNKFTQEYPTIELEYKLCKDFLEFAQLINSSQYFLGNQSLGSAICQGLYHPQIQETHAKEHNCIPFNIYKLEKDDGTSTD